MNYLDTLTFNVLSVCTGAAGLELGLKLAFPATRTICYIEREAYCCEILAERMEEKYLDEAPIWTDIRTFDGKPWCGIVDCISGGYPCQPFSNLGKRRAEQDERHLWPSIARLIREVEPTWCFFENVSNHLQLGFEQVYNELCQMDYQVAAGLFTATEIGAPHQRKRLFIVAYSNNKRCRSSVNETNNKRWGISTVRSSYVPIEQERNFNQSDTNTKTASATMAFPPQPNNWDQWNKIIATKAELKPTVCRMVNGMADRLDFRLRTCGNGVVPAVAAFAWRTLINSLQG